MQINNQLISALSVSRWRNTLDDIRSILRFFTFTGLPAKTQNLAALHYFIDQTDGVDQFGKVDQVVDDPTSYLSFPRSSSSARLSSPLMF